MAGQLTRARRSLFAVHPARTLAIAFGAVILLGAFLLMLPVSSEEGGATGFVTALFTSTSAVCVTGLVVVDTGTYWSGFGEGVILALIQVGGFGIMTMASLLALLVSGKLRLRMQLTAAAETKSFGIGDVRRVLLGVAGTTLAVELAVGAGSRCASGSVTTGPSPSRPTPGFSTRSRRSTTRASGSTSTASPRTRGIPG